VTINSTFAGKQVEGVDNTFVYFSGSNVSLSCNLFGLQESSIYNDSWLTQESSIYNYSWLTDCSTCFPYGQMTQDVAEESVTLHDAGTFTCSASNGTNTYTSEAFTLRVSCKLQSYKTKGNMK